MHSTALGRAALLGAALLATACTSYEQEMPDDYSEVVGNDASPGSVGIAVLLDGHGYNHAPALREYLLDNGIEDVQLVASSMAPVDVVVDGDMGDVDHVESVKTGWIALPFVPFLVGLPIANIEWSGTDAHIALRREGDVVDHFEVDRDGDLQRGTFMFVKWWGFGSDLNAERTARATYDMVLYRLKALAAEGGAQ